MTRWRDCIFDLYGTLVDIRTDEDSPQLWEAMAAYFRREGAAYTPEKLRGAWFRAVEETERRQAAYTAWPEIRVENVFQELYRLGGVEAPMEQAVRAGQYFRALSLVYLRLYDGAAELLKALRANGQRVWLLSNAQRIFTAPELDRLGIAPLFDGICLSSDFGCKKPDRRFFEALLRRYAIDPAGTVMVGNDGACDIRGAQALGLSTVYVRSNLSPVEPLPGADALIETADMDRLRVLLTGTGSAELLPGAGGSRLR